MQAVKMPGFRVVLAALLDTDFGEDELISDVWKKYTVGERWSPGKFYWKIENGFVNLKKNEKFSEYKKEDLAALVVEALVQILSLDDVFKPGTDPFSKTETDPLSKNGLALFEEAIRELRGAQEGDDRPGSDEEQEEKEMGSYGYSIIHALCRIRPKLAFGLDDDNQSAFQSAAEEGLTTVLRVMIQELLRILSRGDPEMPRKNVLDFLRRRHKTKTAFQMATEKFRLGVLKFLLGSYPELADIDSISSTIKAAGEATQTNANVFQVFKMIMEKIDVVKYGNIIWEDAVMIRAADMVNYLLNEIGNSAFATYLNAMVVIKKGTAQMWEMFMLESRKEFMGKDQCSLLHQAVSERKLDIVNSIVKDFPDQVEVNTKEFGYPLQVLQGQEDSTYVDIRNTLLHAMIRSEKLGIQQIRSILNTSQGK